VHSQPAISPSLDSRRRGAGFTLIELLIVVAIIAILAAIAVPNFLEAQVRAKVSRVRADIRTVATALESYAVDNNKVPTMRHRAAGPRPVFDFVSPPGSTARSWPQATIPIELTTPIAYMSSLLDDPFRVLGIVRKNSNGTVIDSNIVIASDPTTRNYIYHNIYELVNDTVSYPGYGFDQLDLREYGTWRLISVGPDREFYGSIGRRVYDPTNGTVSLGDLIRTQAKSDGVSNESTSGSN
jgi:prepilin-type N-terminal cleavage/methylation domain-containing protein